MKHNTDTITSKTHPQFVGRSVHARCPNGHVFMVRRNKDDDTLFLGCSKFPECRETSELTTRVLLELFDAPQLPGMPEDTP